jgi:DNA polymerase-3 subunit delta
MEQVEAAVLNVARYDVSDLRDALKNRDTVRAVRTLEGLRGEDAAPPLVLWALATEARAVAARAGLLHAAKIDRMIKGLARGDVWDEFLQLALRLTQPRTR